MRLLYSELCRVGAIHTLPLRLKQIHCGPGDTGWSFTSPFCSLFLQALQVSYRPEKSLDLLCRQPAPGPNPQFPPLVWSFLGIWRFVGSPEQIEVGDLSHCPEGDTEEAAASGSQGYGAVQVIILE